MPDWMVEIPAASGLKCSNTAGGSRTRSVVRRMSVAGRDQDAVGVRLDELGPAPPSTRDRRSTIRTSWSDSPTLSCSPSGHRRSSRSASRSAGKISSTKACSSPAPRWSPSAAPTRCSSRSRNKRSSLRGCCPGRWSRTRPRRNHPGPLIMVVRFVAFAGATSTRRPQPLGRRHPRRPAHHLGHLCALLPLRPARRAVG